MSDNDEVVLLDDDGRAIGTAPKSSVHGTDTALHLASALLTAYLGWGVARSRRGAMAPAA